jgi:hypothetical protein
MNGPTTSIRADSLRSPQESEVSGSCVDFPGVTRHQPGTEVVLVAGVVSVDGVVTAGVVRTLNPNLEGNNYFNYCPDGSFSVEVYFSLM